MNHNDTTTRRERSELGDSLPERDAPPGVWLDVVVGAIVLAAVLVVVSAVMNGIQSGRWPAGLTPFRDQSQPVK